MTYLRDLFIMRFRIIIFDIVIKCLEHLHISFGYKRNHITSNPITRYQSHDEEEILLAIR